MLKGSLSGESRVTLHISMVTVTMAARTALQYKARPNKPQGTLVKARTGRRKQTIQALHAIAREALSDEALPEAAKQDLYTHISDNYVAPIHAEWHGRKTHKAQNTPDYTPSSEGRPIFPNVQIQHRKNQMKAERDAAIKEMYRNRKKPPKGRMRTT